MGFRVVSLSREAYTHSFVATGVGPRRASEQSGDRVTGILERPSRASEQYPNQTAPLTAIDFVSASPGKVAEGRTLADWSEAR
jgi:hypothetical protein